MTTLARTANQMKALSDTGDKLVDLFFKAGSSRGHDLTPAFTQAFNQSADLAVRLALWIRDVRGGAGERQMGRSFLRALESTDQGVALLLNTDILSKIVELGRWDDLLVFTQPRVRRAAFALIKKALDNGDALCAKWMPRKGTLAVELRTVFGWTPKFYRKRLVELTKVVETQMCAKQWDEINYNHVPSLAMARYKRAFRRNSPERFGSYTTALTKGTPGVKVNAGAVFPYDVIKTYIQQLNGQQLNGYSYGLVTLSNEEIQLIDAQWEALPNYMDNQYVLPVVDVSGSMISPVAEGVSALAVAVSLGLYCADKNEGPYKDAFCTFSNTPELVRLEGTVTQKLTQMCRSHWDMNTNLHGVFDLILKLAREHEVPENEMPQAIIILSDMQFDCCGRFDDSALGMIKRKYAAAGYKVPGVVFWSINSRYNNVPVKYNEQGVALVSGFSPAIMKSVLSSDFEKMNPRSVMLETLMSERYNYNNEVRIHVGSQRPTKQAYAQHVVGEDS